MISLVGSALKSINKVEYRALIKFMTTQRQLKGLTQSQLSELVGRPQSFISKVESCERRLDVTEYLEICFLLDVEFSHVMKVLKEASPYGHERGHRPSDRTS